MRKRNRGFEWSGKRYTKSDSGMQVPEIMPNVFNEVHKVTDRSWRDSEYQAKIF